MEMNELMAEGLRLLLIGMGIVFSFLIVLVFAMKGMSWLAFRLGGHPEDIVLPAASPAVADTDKTALVAVISAAVARYRQNRR